MFAAADVMRAFAGAAGPGHVHATFELDNAAHAAEQAALDLDVVRSPAVSIMMAPNPLQHDGVVSFVLPESGPAHIAIYEVTGRRVAVLLDAARLDAGLHRLPISARVLGPGAYFYRLQSNSGVTSGRFVVVQ